MGPRLRATSGSGDGCLSARGPLAPVSAPRRARCVFRLAGGGWLGRLRASGRAAGRRPPATVPGRGGRLAQGERPESVGGGGGSGRGWTSQARRTGVRLVVVWARACFRGLSPCTGGAPRGVTGSRRRARRGRGVLGAPRGGGPWGFVEPFTSGQGLPSSCYGPQRPADPS